MRRLRGIVAAIVLAATILGGPLALASWGRYPPLIEWRVDNASALLAALTLAGWLAWGAFTAATAAEAMRLITGHRRALPGLIGLQHVAGGLLIAVIAAITLPAAELDPYDDAPGSVTTSATDEARQEPRTEVAELRASESASNYTVAPGDDLWSIAERKLGDGREWRRLRALNPQLSDPLTELAPGTRLNLPASVEPLASRTPPAATVTVHRGDTLSKIAEEHLGDAHRWIRIAEANPQITDPNHIEVGWRLHLPAKRPAEPQRPDQPHSAHRERLVRSDVDAIPSVAHVTAPSTAGRTLPDQAAASQAPASDAAPSQAPAGETAPASPTVGEADDVTSPVPLAMGTLAAAALVSTLEARRLLRLRERAPGRRLPDVSPEASDLRTALRGTERPDALPAITRALRRIGEHCYETGASLPELTSMQVGDNDITFEWDGPFTEPPFGFTGNCSTWIAPVRPPLPDSEHPCPFPALVSLGTTAGGDVLVVDVERSRVLGVAGPAAQRRDALTALVMELACAPWSSELRVVVSGEDAALIALAGVDRVQQAKAELALAKLRQVVTRRRQALAASALGDLRVDPERADAVAGYVFCFLDGLGPTQIEELELLLDGPPLGVSVVLSSQESGPAQWQIGGSPQRPEGRLGGHPGSLAAHAISAEIRESLADLLAEREAELAPWWTEGNVYPMPQREGDDVDVIRVVEQPAHPFLQVIGSAELDGASGPQPARSRQQLVEMCAWLLEHPGATATQMAAGLIIAESTRRSNLSRLRTWLGNDHEGEAYLPDAYSGRISLHPAITSDWHRLQIMLGPGITRLPDSTLIAALRLVRGAPLADAAPGQWCWAEELRTDISSALRDVGLVLVERALKTNDLDLARWAASRALVVAPEDELLLRARLRTEHQAGNRADAERLANHLTRHARNLGVDLLPGTVELCQQVVEGQPRARA